jgi:hypothetical protein
MRREKKSRRKIHSTSTLSVKRCEHGGSLQSPNKVQFTFLGGRIKLLNAKNCKKRKRTKRFVQVTSVAALLKKQRTGCSLPTPREQQV